MTTPLVDSYRWRTVLKIVVVASVICLVFGLTLGRGSVSSMMQGAFTGACISGVIAYLGNVVNTTARIAEICRSLDRKVLASREVLSTMEPVGAFRALSIGPATPRGKAEPLELVALEPA